MVEQKIAGTFKYRMHNNDGFVSSQARRTAHTRRKIATNILAINRLRKVCDVLKTPFRIQNNSRIALDGHVDIFKLLRAQW
jgi:hypothetical protein